MDFKKIYERIWAVSRAVPIAPAVSRAVPIAPAPQTSRLTAMPEKLPLWQGAIHKDCGRVFLTERGQVFVECAVGQLGETVRCKMEGRGFDSPLRFFIDIIFPAALWSWVRFSL